MFSSEQEVLCWDATTQLRKFTITVVDEKVTSLSKEIFPLLKELGFALGGYMVYRFIASFFRTMTGTNKIFYPLNEKISKNPPFPLQGKVIENHLTRMMQILSSPRQDSIRSVIIIGPPGAGKTALVEEFVRRMVFDKSFVPPHLKREVSTFFGLKKNIIPPTVYKFDTLNITRGTSYHGMLEQNLYEVLNFMQEHPDDMYYMDEFHKINNDLSPNNRNLPDYFKELLTKGVRIIAATTEEDYQRYIVTNGAFADRFIVIHLKQPTEKQTVDNLMSIKGKWEENGMTFKVEVIQYLVESLQNVPGNFNRKAIKVLDILSTKWAGNTKPHELTKEDIDEELKHWEKRNLEPSGFSLYPHYSHSHQDPRSVRFYSTGGMGQARV